jgi:hypothetical protein
MTRRKRIVLMPEKESPYGCDDAGQLHHTSDAQAERIGFLTSRREIGLKAGGVAWRCSWINHGG